MFLLLSIFGASVMLLATVAIKPHYFGAVSTLLTSQLSQKKWFRPIELSHSRHTEPLSTVQRSVYNFHVLSALRLLSPVSNRLSYQRPVIYLKVVPATPQSLSVVWSMWILKVERVVL